MRRVFEILRVVFDMSFWQDFIEQDMRDESRMMHDYE